MYVRCFRPCSGRGRSCSTAWTVCQQDVGGANFVGAEAERAVGEHADDGRCVDVDNTADTFRLHRPRIRRC